MKAYPRPDKLEEQVFRNTPLFRNTRISLIHVQYISPALEMAMSVNVNLREQLRELEIGLGNVEETDKELGRGAYGVVVELKVNGLRYITINSAVHRITDIPKEIYCMDSSTYMYWAIP